MFIVFYPVSCLDQQVINHPTDAFQSFDTNNENEAKDILRILISQFGMDELHIYNVSQSGSRTWFNSIDALVNDINAQELAVDENFWCINLNLTEEQMREVTDHYSNDFVIKDGRSNNLLCFEDGELIAYGDYEDMVEDSKDGDKGFAVFSDYGKDGDKCTIHVYKVLYNRYDKVGTFDVDCDWNTEDVEWKKKVYPKLCEAIRR